MPGKGFRGSLGKLGKAGRESEGSCLSIDMGLVQRSMSDQVENWMERLPKMHGKDQEESRNWKKGVPVKSRKTKTYMAE